MLASITNLRLLPLLSLLRASRLSVTGAHAPGGVCVAHPGLPPVGENSPATPARGQLTFANWLSSAVDSGD